MYYMLVNLHDVAVVTAGCLTVVTAASLIMWFIALDEGDRHAEEVVGKFLWWEFKILFVSIVLLIVTPSQ